MMQAKAAAQKGGGDKRLAAEVEAEEAAELDAMRQAGFTRPGEARVMLIQAIWT